MILANIVIAVKVRNL